MFLKLLLENAKLIENIIKQKMGFISILLPMIVAPFMPTQMETPQKPNIVFILTDDLGIGDVGAFNKESKIPTPNIDRLVMSGVRFTDAHSSSSVSTPTRYGILTGRYNWRSRLKGGVLMGYDKPLIPSTRSTMASMLKKAGYTTASIGKWHLGCNWVLKDVNDSTSIDFTKPISDGPRTVGFDYSFNIVASLDVAPYVWVENDTIVSQPDHCTKSDDAYAFYRLGLTGKNFSHIHALKRMVGKTTDYIKAHKQRENPFFLYVPFTAPHTPIMPENRFKNKTGLNPYGDFVVEVDYYVGEIMKALKDSGLEKNTLVVFTSDNGCSNRANFNVLLSKGHNPSSIYKGHKASIYDGGHRIPCVVSWPGKYTSHDVNQTICLTDFYATFAAMMNYQLKDNEAEDSYNLLACLENNDPQSRIREATVHHSAKGEFAIRQGKWKLIYNLITPKNVKHGDISQLHNIKYNVQLYNMEKDPSEKTNVAANKPEVVERMRKVLVRYVMNGRSTPGKPQNNDGPLTWGQLVFMSTKPENNY